MILASVTMICTLCVYQDSVKERSLLIQMHLEQLRSDESLQSLVDHHALGKRIVNDYHHVYYHKADEQKKAGRRKWFGYIRHAGRLSFG